MTAPVIPLYSGTVPNRNQSANDFADNADDWLAYQAPLAADYNGLATYIDGVAVDIDADKDAAAQSVIDASGFADDASGFADDSAASATTSQSNANFKGRWSDAVGAATVPSSYSNNGQTWQLLQNIADITADEPVTGAANWQAVNDVSMANVNVSDLENPLLHAFAKNDLVRVMNGATVLTSERSTSATFVDVNGVVRTADIDDPREELAGWLFEGDGENLALYSEEFDNAAWVKNSGGTGVAPVVTANNAIAPDGTLTADTVVFDTGAGVTSGDRSLLSQSFSGLSVAELHSQYFYVKGGAGDVLVIRGVNGSSFSELTLDGSWQRLGVVESAFSANQTVEIGIRQAVPNVINSTITVEMWGAQLEESPFATSYKPTTAATETRSADDISFPVQGNFRESEGCIFLKAGVIGDAGSEQAILDISDGTGDNRILMRRDADKINILIVNGGVNQVDFSTSFNMDPSTQYEVAVNYKDNDVELFVDRVSAAADTLVAIPSGLLRVDCGQLLNATANLFGHIQDLRFYDRNLTLDEIKYLGGV